MIEFVAVKTSDTTEFANKMADLLNDGWIVTWQGSGTSGGSYAVVQFLATLKREVPSVTKTVEP